MKKLLILGMGLSLTLILFFKVQSFGVDLEPDLSIKGDEPYDMDTSPKVKIIELEQSKNKYESIPAINLNSTASIVNLNENLPSDVINLSSDNLLNDGYVQLIPGEEEIQLPNTNDLSLTKEIVPGEVATKLKIYSGELESKNSERYVVLLPGTEPVLLPSEDIIKVIDDNENLPLDD